MGQSDQVKDTGVLAKTASYMDQSVKETTEI
jgi:hypothetical protein